MTYKIGETVEGVITGIQPYGAFVSLDEQTQGLIHISEVRLGYIKNIRDVIEIDQKVAVQIIDIDEYSKKISLSLRTLQSFQDKNRKKKKRFFTNSRYKIAFSTIEQAAPTWIEEALEDLRKR